MMKRYARKVGRHAGRNVHRVPFVVLFIDSRHCKTLATEEGTVLAYSAVDAANLLRDEYATRPETQIYAWGPKGGEVFRFVGWESAVAMELLEHREGPGRQMHLPLAERDLTQARAARSCVGG